MAECRSCGAPVVWAITVVGGRRMPLDPEPVARDGAVLAARRTSPGGGLLVRSVAADEPLLESERPARSHFASCPNASAHRSPRPKD